MMILRSLPILAALFLLTSACVPPEVKLRTFLPGEFLVPQARELALVEARGQQEAVDDFFDWLSFYAAEGSYFQVTDRSREGIELVVEGETTALRLDGVPVKLGGNEAGLRFDVIDYEVDEGYMSRGISGLAKGLIAEAGFSVSLVRSDGTPTLISVPTAGRCEDAYDEDGEHEIRSDASLLRCAAAKAAKGLMQKLNPVVLEQSFPLQGSGDALEPVFKAVREGRLEEALRLAEAYRHAHPEQHEALFNEALLRDTLEQHAEALELYDRAIALAPPRQAYYRTARFGAQQRLDAQASFQNGVAPVIGTR